MRYLQLVELDVSFRCAVTGTWIQAPTKTTYYRLNSCLANVYAHWRHYRALQSLIAKPNGSKKRWRGPFRGLIIMRWDANGCRGMFPAGSVVSKHEQTGRVFGAHKGWQTQLSSLWSVAQHQRQLQQLQQQQQHPKQLAVLWHPLQHRQRCARAVCGTRGPL